MSTLSHSTSKSASASSAPAPSSSSSSSSSQANTTLQNFLPTPPPPPPEKTNKHALTSIEKQRQQLARLLKDPSKPAPIPVAPKEKQIRPAREMMKNVQGSSAGAGSGEFHVYKASRRREYERLRLLDDQARKEAIQDEFQTKKKQWEAEAEAKTAKNRARREKKKWKAKAKMKSKEEEKEEEGDEEGGTGTPPQPDEAGCSGRKVHDGNNNKNKNAAPLKKRRLISGTEIVFRKPGEVVSEDDDEEEEEEGGKEEGGEKGDEAGPGYDLAQYSQELRPEDHSSNAAAEALKIRIIEDD